MQWTFFLDILGYGNEQKTIDNQEKADKFIEFMKENKSLIDFEDSMNKSFYSDKDINIYELYEIKSVFISDSFVLTSIPKDKEFREEDYYYLSSSIILELTFQMFYFIENILDKQGLIIRGGISNKFTDIDTESSLAVGQGLIEAYKLESNYENPRILLSKDISSDKKLMSFLDKDSKKYGEDFSIFLKDTDDFFYLNYLGFMLAILRRSENDRQNMHKYYKDNYGVTQNIIEGLQELNKYKEPKEFDKELSIFIKKNNLSEKELSKLISYLKEIGKNSNVLEEKVGHIQSVKYGTIKTLGNFQKVIKRNLEEQINNSDKKLYNKYLWLQKYHNNTIESFNDLEFIQKFKVID